MNSGILALDLGSETGYAYRSNGVLVAGAWVLAKQKELKHKDCCSMDIRLDRLWKKLCELQLTRPFHTIVYEDVQFVHSRAQAHLWASFRAVVWLYASQSNVRTICVPVATLKKFACGNGHATKEAMISALLFVEENLPIEAKNDNAADAIHLLRWAEQAQSSPPRSSIERLTPNKSIIR